MFKKLQILLMLLFIMVIVSLPILQAGFFSDDIVNSSGAGAMQLAHLNLWQYTLMQVKGFCVGQGRILLDSFFNVPFFYYFQDPLGYQIVRVLCIWLSVASGTWFVYLVTQNKAASLLFILLFPLCWSIEDMSNALVSYGIMLQMLVLCIMLALCFFIKWLENKKVAWFVGALLMYGFALTLYEPGVIVFFGVGYLAWRAQQSTQQYVLVMLPFILVSCIYLGVYHLLRQHGSYDGTTLGAMNAHAIMAFLYQLTGPIPLSYGLLRGHYLQTKYLLPFFRNPWHSGLIVILFMTAWMLFCRLLNQLVIPIKQRKLLIMMAIPFCVIPSLLMAVSIKYQAWLHWGFAYVPGYIQYIGMAFLLLYLLNKIKRFHRAVASVLSLILCLGFMFNSILVQQENSLFKYPRALDDQALQAGLLNHFPESGVLMTQDSWVNPAYLMQHTRRVIQVVPFTQQNIELYASAVPLFLMVHRGDAVILQRVQK